MASTYLTYTPSSAVTLGTKATISFWVKRSGLDSGTNFYGILSSNGGWNDGTGFAMGWREDMLIWYNLKDNSGYRTYPSSLRKFRDTSAWYHIVYKIDTTQAAVQDRITLYVNGVDEGDMTTNAGGISSAIPDQNNAPYQFFDNGDQHQVGRGGSAGSTYFDGSMSHFHFIDGTAYDASAFGEYDANGVWKIKTSPSVTYGNNGFFILKDGNSVTDQSGNSNNFTVGGGTLTNTEDCPSNFFATMNALDNYWQSATFSKGNNTIVTDATNYAATMSTLGMTSGKYYCEMKATNIANGYSQFGIRGTFVTSIAQGAGQGTDGYAYIANGGQKRNNDSSSAYGTTWNNGDIIGCAVDLDNNYIYWSRNGTWQNSGDPTSGASGTGAAFTLGTPSSGAYFFAASDNDADAGTSNTFDFNFGNGYFGTTAVSSAGTNASGIGIFEYDVPTGYTALSTKGLNL